MKRHLTVPIVMLLASTVLSACGWTASAPPTPTIYHAPGTSAVYRPVALPPSTSPQPGPTTLLLLGTDRRGSDGDTDNADTIMLLYLDPDASRAVVLSIPRDLYVEIPGHGQGRINTAYATGEQGGTGGLALARQTVSTTLGVPVQHAALIDFDAFVTLIDAMGGVDVDVPHAILDPSYPDDGTGYDPFYLPAGQQHLDGATALKYARTRATPRGDFDRAARQRQIVRAVRDRVTSLDLLPNLIKQSPQLWASLQGAFEADLTLAEIIDLAIAASRVPGNQITMAAIDDTCTYPWITPGGAAVLLPNQTAIQALVTDLFTPAQAAASIQ